MGEMPAGFAVDNSLEARAANPVLAVFLAVAVALVASTGHAAPLPQRLVVLLDGVSYRDMKAFQEGVSYTNPRGRWNTRRGFDDGYFPVSRLVSTFPSVSDVAWTEMLGDRPLPGYQRTYFDLAGGREVRQNGVTTTMEYEFQMHWELRSGYRRALGYVYPHATFKHEVRQLVKSFLATRDNTEYFYALIRASDDAQHTTGDIFALLDILDDELRSLGERYQTLEGRKLEILILSDHGNNHAGAGKRVPICTFLKKAGYRLSDHIVSAKDVVLPTAGIESWVELHCAPSETERLAESLTHLRGVDCITARIEGSPDHFLVLNARGERARIEWRSEQNAFRYVPERGDPLGYQPALDALARAHEFDSEGFAPAAAWMRETLAHRYPIALERIVRGHTQVVMNPCAIIISLKNGYVHTSWILKQLSSLIRQGGTHGTLDYLSSNGILLSNFAPMQDTSTCRVATQCEGFVGLRDASSTQTRRSETAQKSESPRAGQSRVCLTMSAAAVTGAGSRVALAALRRSAAAGGLPWTTAKVREPNPSGLAGTVQ